MSRTGTSLLDEHEKRMEVFLVPQISAKFFAHRARECGWSLEEVAYYLGHITKSGMPAIQTTIRYTQVSREHVKEKLKLLRG